FRAVTNWLEADNVIHRDMPEMTVLVVNNDLRVRRTDKCEVRMLHTMRIAIGGLHEKRPKRLQPQHAAKFCGRHIKFSSSLSRNITDHTLKRRARRRVALLGDSSGLMRQPPRFQRVFHCN